MSSVFYRDIDLSFEKTSTDDIPIVTDLNAIKVSLYNTLFVRDNENFFADDFGYSLDDMLMEFADNETIVALRNLVENAVENDERIKEIEDLNIEVKPDTQEIIVHLKVIIQNLIEPQEVDLILKKTR